MKPRIPDEKITSRKDMVHFNDELLDTEALRATEIIASVQMKYQYKAATESNLEAMRDEILTRLAEIHVLAEVDPTPVFYGEPPIVELRGKITMDDIHKYGFDHEQKAWEVNKAHERGEDYLGEKESSKSRKEK